MIFTENQSFRIKWFALIVALGSALLLFDFYVTKRVEFNILPSTYLTLLFIILFSSLIFFLIDFNTRIDGYGIHLKTSKIPSNGWKLNWGEVQRAFIRECNPLIEYRGWGIRKSRKNGRAFTVRGRKGLQLELINGEKIFIGTQKTDELKKVLNHLKEQQRITCIETT
jgi:hypothetical protein